MKLHENVFPKRGSSNIILAQEKAINKASVLRRSQWKPPSTCNPWKILLWDRYAFRSVLKLSLLSSKTCSKTCSGFGRLPSENSHWAITVQILSHVILSSDRGFDRCSSLLVFQAIACAVRVSCAWVRMRACVSVRHCFVCALSVCIAYSAKAI